MEATWTVDAHQSDVLIKMRHSIIAYLGGQSNTFDGHVNMINNEITDASIAFSVNVNNRRDSIQQFDTALHLNDFFDIDEHPIISFKSTSFQKLNNINFFKGELTIKDITKIVELEAEIIGTDAFNGGKRVAFEVIANINRQDFDLNYNAYTQNGGLALGRNIKLIANLEFSAESLVEHQNLAVLN